MQFWHGCTRHFSEPSWSEKAIFLFFFPPLFALSSHQVLAGTDASMAQGFERRDALKGSKPFFFFLPFFPFFSLFASVSKAATRRGVCRHPGSKSGAGSFEKRVLADARTAPLFFFFSLPFFFSLTTSRKYRRHRDLERLVSGWSARAAFFFLFFPPLLSSRRRHDISANSCS